MKKILIVSLLCLITNFQGFSQTVSTNKNQDCVVPCETLRKALIMKEDKQLLEKKFEIVKDSVKILSEVISFQGKLVTNKDQEISLYKKNQEAQVNIISEKDKQISEYKKIVRKQKIYKFIGFGTGTLGLAAVVLILL